MTVAEYWIDLPRKAVLFADTKTRDSLAQRKLPVENRLGSGDFNPTSNKIKVMTIKVSKSLEFPLVALSGVGQMQTARLFYVAATRARRGW